MISDDADARDGACNNEPGVIVDHRRDHGSYAGDDHSHQQKVSTPGSIGHWAKDQRADHIPHEIKENRQTDIICCRWRRTTRNNLDASLDKRDVDVENIVKCEKKSDANDSYEETGKRPNRDAIEPRNQHAGGFSVGLHQSGSIADPCFLSPNAHLKDASRHFVPQAQVRPIRAQGRWFVAISHFWPKFSAGYSRQFILARDTKKKS